MGVQFPTPNPNLTPLSPEEVPADPERDERAPAPLEGDDIDKPDVLNPVQ